MKTAIPLLTLVALLGSACTEPGQTTAVGAAAGGAVGAGLGAIIGNQTGDPGAGFVLGAASGAGVGGAIGNALEAQEKTIRSQDEALERQERMLSSQRAEIDELKKVSQDSVSFKPADYDAGSRYAPPTPALAANPPVPAARPESSTLGSYRWGEKEGTSAQPAPAAPAPAKYSADSADCVQAGEEMRTGNNAPSSADKLFHYRRALRLCPDKAVFHNSLGEAYLMMQRKEDAEYEFREALRLEPGFAPAQQNLKAISR